MTADLTTLVNPFIGTQEDGNTFPGPALPFGMVQISPDTGGNVGYNYDHTSVWGFSHTHLSGVGCPSATEVSLMPASGPIGSTDPRSYAQPLDHAHEYAIAGYYSVDLPDGVSVELTATTRTGWHRYNFPAGDTATVLINTGLVKGVPSGADVSEVSIVDDRTVEGSVTQSGFCGDCPPHTVYFCARFSQTFSSCGTWYGGELRPDERVSRGAGDNGGWVSFDGDAPTVVVKVGLSYTGVDGARRNLDAETHRYGFDFDAVREAAHQVWRDALGTLAVGDGEHDRLVAFYTSLYHALLHPNIASDVDGSYQGFDNAVHTAEGYTPYQMFSLWDTYRAQNQLVALLYPQVARDCALSLLAIDDEFGWLPRWTMYNTETNTMTGDPVTPFLVDIWARGLLDGHEERAYAALHRNATGVPPAHLKLNGRNGNPWYTTLGYIPAGVTGEPDLPMDSDCRHPASSTLEYAVADAALAIMAKALGHDEDAAVFAARGQSYRAIFDPSIGFFRPRTTDGAWLEPYHPADGAHAFHEAGAYQYQWLVPQDTAGLIELLGGAERANARLDQFFVYDQLLSDLAGTAHHKWVNGAYDYYSFTTYNPNNEPDLLAPYTYLWTGEPHKTATVVRGALTLFTNSPHGVTGNDDLGTMSAWYVFSSIGVYPGMNGASFYCLTSPQFDDITVTVGAYRDVQGGTLTIRTPGVTEAARYVVAVELDGRVTTRTWLSHADLARGGSLVFTVDSTPGEWGTSADDAPPSAGAVSPAQ